MNDKSPRPGLGEFTVTCYIEQFSSIKYRYFPMISNDQITLPDSRQIRWVSKGHGSKKREKDKSTLIAVLLTINGLSRRTDQKLDR